MKMWNETEKRCFGCEEQFLWAARQLNQKEEVHTEFFIIFFAKISISKLIPCVNTRSLFVYRRRKIINFVLKRE